MQPAVPTETTRPGRGGAMVANATGVALSAASRHRRPGHAPRPVIADVLGGLAGIGFGLTIALVLINESAGSLASPGGWFSAAGRLTGFTGSYLMLLMVFLIARVPGLERAVGQDQLVRWHRRIGGWPIVLIALHIVFITLGYSRVDGVSWIKQMNMFILHYPNILASLVGFGLLVLVGVSSYRTVRRRQKYETWWVVHLYTYLALALAFAHQVVTGIGFLHHPLAKAYWIAIWALGALAITSFRFVLPVVRNLKYQLRVVTVDEEAPGVFSIVLTGKQLSNLAVSGGQFFQWRILTRGLWWQAHPYSLSAMPNPPYVRVTIKDLGDHSGAVAHLKPGTRIFAEGPYGTFTHHRRSTEHVVLIGAGVGITPLRALLEDLPPSVDVTVVTRGSTEDELIHRDEIATLVKERGGVLHELIGSRAKVRIDATSLRRLVPSITASDVYICGPATFTDHLTTTVAKIGVPREQIHTEAFAF